MKPRISKRWLVALLPAVALYVTAFHAVPMSTQVAYGALSACGRWGEELQHGSLNLGRSPIWVAPIIALSHLYRWKQWHFGAPDTFDDRHTGLITPLHVILTVAEVDSSCESELAVAMARHIELGTPIDAYDGEGLTPLHYAIIAAKPGFVRLLMEHGADPRAVVKRNTSIAGMTAAELAAYIMDKNTDPVRREIASLVANDGAAR